MWSAPGWQVKDFIVGEFRQVCHGGHDFVPRGSSCLVCISDVAAFQNFKERYPAIGCLLAHSHSSSSIYYSFMEITNELWEEREKRIFWNALISCQQALQTELRNFDRMGIFFLSFHFLAY